MSTRVPVFRQRWPLRAGMALLAAGAMGMVSLPRVAAPARTEAEAQRFVRLALAFDRIRPGEVDAWFGPQRLSLPATTDPKDADELAVALGTLSADLAERGEGADERRRTRLRARLERLRTSVDLVRATGRPMPFAQEAQRLYAIDLARTERKADWRRVRTELDGVLPGEGPPAERAERYFKRFIVPTARRERVFTLALAECRRRTLAQWPLPGNETVDVQWTMAVPAAWHRYRGKMRSTIQINPDAVALPGQAIDVACHEGYPGHHAQFVAMEAAAGPAGPAIEDRLVMLRSPETAIREGAADAGVDIAFPPQDRIAFLRNVLFPAAGFDPAEAARYARIEGLVRRLSGAALPILARYRDEKISRHEASLALREDALLSSPEAMLDYTDRFGAYATGYTVARNEVKAGLALDCGSGWPGLRRFAERPDVMLAALQARRTAPVHHITRKELL
ncbi:hypothetical protein [Novosphingobium sp. BL-52-GroH]|uniref:hypothetical protein n=1 Tax=Novosphingobium sp. BL-52-GroH TaxID=3349877 RepID=UPI00384B5091